MSFQPAVKKNGKLRIAIVGPAGSGKTYTGLEILKLMETKDNGVIDSEQGSSEKYADLFKFKVSKPTEYSLRTYLKEIVAAKEAKLDGLMLDSLSPTWNGKGGALEQVDNLGGNKFANGWKTVTPLYNELIQSLLTYPGHVICTMRVKTEYAMEVVDGKSIPKRVGLKPIQRDDIEYEFDFLLGLGTGGSVEVMKQRGCPELEGFVGTRKDIPWIVSQMKKLVE